MNAHDRRLVEGLLFMIVFLTVSILVYSTGALDAVASSFIGAGVGAIAINAGRKEEGD